MARKTQKVKPEPGSWSVPTYTNKPTKALMHRHEFRLAVKDQHTRDIIAQRDMTNMKIVGTESEIDRLSGILKAERATLAGLQREHEVLTDLLEDRR